MSMPINPETKVGALLEAYPGIEKTLIEWVPAFEKLKNPILRKTVAKVATLQQAAKIGGVSVRDLVIKLREATGQDGPNVPEIAQEELAASSGDAPSWLKEELVRRSIDADAMLERGVHPLGDVRQGVVSLKAGEIVKLTSAFRPQPLMDAMAASGLAVYSHEASPGHHATYFCRISDDPGLTQRVSQHSCDGGGCA
jgi:hypothetical protein